MSLEHRHSVLDALLFALDEEHALELIAYRGSKATAKPFDVYRAKKTAMSLNAAIDKTAKFWEIVRTKANRENPSHEYVLAVFFYDPLTGLFVRKSNGKVCGVSTNAGYVTISIAGRLFLAHRAAWFYVHGEWPEQQIDHIDRNRKNNALSNLRLATNQQNCWNADRGRNTSGVVGAYWDTRKHKWIATVRVNGRSRYLGQFETKEEAGHAYERAVAYRGQFGVLQ